MSTLTAIHNHILFQFEDERKQHMGVTQFEESTDWGFKFVRVDDSTQSARWAIVSVVGPECDSEIQPGMRVLVDRLMWSEGFEYEGEMYWRTDSNQIIGVDDAYQD